MFENMRYCPETVLIQSAFFLGAKLTNLEENTDDVLTAVKVVKDAILEVSRGLALTEEKDCQLLPIEKQALHCNVHFWIYKTWCKTINTEHSDASDGGDDDDDLDGFPILPKFSTRLYIAIVEQLQWEQLLVECLLHSSLPALLVQVKEITAIILAAPDNEDITLFALMLDNLLGHHHSQTNSMIPLMDGVLIKSLVSLTPLVRNTNMQVTILKKLIEVAFWHCFGVELMSHGNELHKLTHGFHVGKSIVKSLDSINEVEQQNMKFNELQQLQENLELEFSPARLHKAVNIEAKTTDDKDLMSKEINHEEFSNVLNVVFELFSTQHWTAVTHWEHCQDSMLGCMNVSAWHPLHQWLLALYSTQQAISKKSEKLNNFYKELGKYVDAFATITEKDWVSKALEGFVSDWDCMCGNIEECLDSAEIQLTSMFSSKSIEETLSMAVWRVNENLEGSEDCFDWLLTTEEFFDNPVWLECIQNNALRYSRKDQVTMLVDVLCMQRQVLEFSPESGRNFDVIKKVIIDVFKDLPSLVQEDIIKYAFTMSVTSGLDIQHDSIFFAPDCEENKKALQDQLQEVFNKLVDIDKVEVLCDIKEMVLLCPYLVLCKVLRDVMKYGHSNKAVYKILQEIPALCTMSTSNLSPRLVCQALPSLIESVNTKQEEKNLTSLVQQLLKSYKKGKSQLLSQPLLNITELIQTCIVPRLTLHNQYNITTMKLTLKLLKASLMTLTPKDPTTRTFILKYFIPIVLMLMKYLNACKVSWEGMSPRVTTPLSLAEVCDLRSSVTDVLVVSMGIIEQCFQGDCREITGAIHWLTNKASELEWSTSLYLSYLQTNLLSRHSWCIPSCIMDVCDLGPGTWTGFTLENYDPVLGLFESCAVSESILKEVTNKLHHKSVTQISESVIVKSLCKCMSYFSSVEISRVIVVCRQLLQDNLVDVTTPVVMTKSINDQPSLQSTIKLSSVLYQVFQLVSQPCCLSWATPAIVGNMVKHFVHTVKGVTKELLANKSRCDKELIEDVFACIFTNTCLVICLVPVDVTDPLFILALDVSAHVGQRHHDVMKSYVAMVPTSAYTQSLTQKLST